MTISRACKIGVTLAVLVAVASLAHAAPRETPSGLPVPRYLSLKFGTVNVRAGPGDDYRPLWTYRAKGLPVQVIAETRDWRRLCGPQGRVGWVKATGVSGQRTVLNLASKPLALRRGPRPAARIAAYLAPRALAELKRCKAGWCKLRLPGGSGWALASALWGTDERAQCR
jgi:SH3-like domain-containing protein